jgi:hypothetical protein
MEESQKSLPHSPRVFAERFATIVDWSHLDTPPQDQGTNKGYDDGTDQWKGHTQEKDG